MTEMRGEQKKKSEEVKIRIMSRWRTIDRDDCVSALEGCGRGGRSLGDLADHKRTPVRVDRQAEVWDDGRPIQLDHQRPDPAGAAVIAALVAALVVLTEGPEHRFVLAPLVVLSEPKRIHDTLREKGEKKNIKDKGKEGYLIL